MHFNFFWLMNTSVCKVLLIHEMNYISKSAVFQHCHGNSHNANNVHQDYPKALQLMLLNSMIDVCQQ